MHARDAWHTTTAVRNVRKKHGLVTKFGAGLCTSRARSGIELEDVNPMCVITITAMTILL